MSLTGNQYTVLLTQGSTFFFGYATAEDEHGALDATVASVQTKGIMLWDAAIEYTVWSGVMPDRLFALTQPHLSQGEIAGD